jgi:hypothetical protein
MSLQDQLKHETETCYECSGHGTVDILRCECGTIAEKVKDGAKMTETKVNHKKKQVVYTYYECKCPSCNLIDMIDEVKEECEVCKGEGWI